MKLKERVILTLLLSVFVLFIVKFKQSKYRRDPTIEFVDSDDDETIDNLEQMKIDVNIDRSLVKRDTKIKDKIDKSVKNKVIVSNKIDAGNKENLVNKGLGDVESNSNENKNDLLEMDPWDIWWTMVSDRHVTSPDDTAIQRLLQGLATREILVAKTLRKGTQLKVSLLLEGTTQQKVVFKPMRYPRDHIITGKIYDGFDRHNAEIAAFHLDRILGFFRAPPVVGRKIDLDKEIKPVGEEALLKTFFNDENGDTCFYGVCYYCKKAEAACAKGNIMEGSVTIWLPDGWTLARTRHPWQRTYNDKKARWELDKNYCHDLVSVSPYDSGPRLLDVIDTSIFDFLIGNGDRHHYETFKKGGPRGMLLHLDNAKSFGNPSVDDSTILYPLSQCCRVRKSTYQRLFAISTDQPEEELLSSRLRRSLLSDPVSPVLSDSHLEALDRRLKLIKSTIRICLDTHKRDKVIIEDGL